MRSETVTIQIGRSRCVQPRSRKAAPGLAASSSGQPGAVPTEGARDSAADDFRDGIWVPSVNHRWHVECRTRDIAHTFPEASRIGGHADHGSVTGFRHRLPTQNRSGPSQDQEL